MGGRCLMKRKPLVILLLALLLFTACGSDESTIPETMETVPAEYAGQTNPFGAEAASQGAEVYQTYCASCHGETGKGDGPASASLVPPTRNLTELQQSVGDDYLFWRISEGKSGTAMVSWRAILTDEQIWQVLSFIRTLE